MVVGIGYFSVYFFKLNFFLKKQFGKIRNPYNRVWTGGIIIGLFIAVLPALYGEGYVTIQALLQGKYTSLLANSFFSEYQFNPWWLIGFTALTLFGKSLASLLTIYAGGNGGTFGPSLVMGGLFGFLFAFTVNHVGILFHLNTPQLNITNFIVVGMAASLSGIMHAPLTGIFLIAEITGGYALMVPLMIVSAITYFINKANTKFSIYTKTLADSGELMSHEHKDSNILRRMKLKYLIEKDFVILKPEDTPKSRSFDIIHTQKNIFPVVDNDGILSGIVNTDLLLEILVNKDEKDINKKIKNIFQPAPDCININTNMFEVMAIMDTQNIRIFPVVNDKMEYQGFVSKSGIMNKYRELLKRDSDFM